MTSISVIHTNGSAGYDVTRVHHSHRIAHHLNSASHLLPLIIKGMGDDRSYPLCTLPFIPKTSSSSGFYPFSFFLQLITRVWFVVLLILLLCSPSVLLEGNERAERIVSHSNNDHHVSTLSNGTLALDVGFHLHGKSSRTLATLGRGFDADIYVEGSSISRVQCSFEIDLDAGVVMLYDRSFGKTTQIWVDNATMFERERDQR